MHELSTQTAEEARDHALRNGALFAFCGEHTRIAALAICCNAVSTAGRTASRRALGARARARARARGPSSASCPRASCCARVGTRSCSTSACWTCSTRPDRERVAERGQRPAVEVQPAAGPGARPLCSWASTRTRLRWTSTSRSRTPTFSPRRTACAWSMPRVGTKWPLLHDQC